MSKSQLLPEVSTGDKVATAQLQVGAPGGECLVKIGGDWRLNEPVPSWAKVLGKRTAVNVRIVRVDHRENRRCILTDLCGLQFKDGFQGAAGIGYPGGTVRP